MKIAHMIVASALCAAFAGCSVFNGEDDTPPPDNSSISVVIREGRNLKDVIAAAAARRGWEVNDTGANTLRLKILQRKNVVVVDAEVIDATHYSLRQVESNIPTRKYVQWIHNLTSAVTNIATGL